jgi:hypothetical protein
MQAQLEINQKHEVLQHRAQFAVRTITASCQVKAPQVATDLYTATSIDVMMERLKVALEDTADLLTVSRMKRKGGKDNAHRLSERLAVLGALRALDKMLTAYVKNDFRAVGYGLGDAWRALHLPADFILKTGRKLLEIKE